MLDDKVAFITGAGSGMGKACTILFAREGAKVVAGDISGAEKDTAAAAGPAVMPLHCDVTKEPDVEAAISAAVGDFGRLDIVCNVAAIGLGGAAADVTMEDYDRMFDINMRGVILGMKHGIRAMLEARNGGSIINWAAIGAVTPSPMTALYHATKGGVTAITRSAAADYGAQGIRVNAIMPGFIMTEGMGAAAVEWYPEVAEKSPMGRAGESTEVAEVAAFLASDKASYVTGVSIAVDGGWLVKLPY